MGLSPTIWKGEHMLSAGRNDLVVCPVCRQTGHLFIDALPYTTFVGEFGPAIIHGLGAHFSEMAVHHGHFRCALRPSQMVKTVYQLDNRAAKLYDEVIPASPDSEEPFHTDGLLPGTWIEVWFDVTPNDHVVLGKAARLCIFEGIDYDGTADHVPVVGEVIKTARIWFEGTSYTVPLHWCSYNGRWLA
jgi:hypothetical protein